MSSVFVPSKCTKPLRVLGVNLGTTNSVMTEIKWQPGSTPETKVIQIEQDTPLEYKLIQSKNHISEHQG
jgi:molecular chaperone DnaK (HSP70)